MRRRSMLNIALRIKRGAFSVHTVSRRRLILLERRGGHDMKFNTTRATPALVMANAMMAMAVMAIAYGPVGAQDLQREFIGPAG